MVLRRDATGMPWQGGFVATGFLPAGAIHPRISDLTFGITSQPMLRQVSVIAAALACGDRFCFQRRIGQLRKRAMRPNSREGLTAAGRPTAPSIQRSFAVSP